MSEQGFFVPLGVGTRAFGTSSWVYRPIAEESSSTVYTHRSMKSETACKLFLHEHFRQIGKVTTVKPRKLTGVRKGVEVCAPKETIRFERSDCISKEDEFITEAGCPSYGFGRFGHAVALRTRTVLTATWNGSAAWDCPKGSHRVPVWRIPESVTK